MSDVIAPTPEQMRYLRVLAEKYPTIAAASSEIINLEALLRLPKGTEHFMSDLHGENEAFIHILNSASGVIREKIDTVLGDSVPDAERAELATLIYYPNQKLPELKARQEDLDAWYRKNLLWLIELCRFVSSKHTRDHVRSCLPANCGHIIDELLHAHFEDHDKDLYYGQIIDSIIRHDRADAYIVRFCEVIKRLAVDRLHIVGDLFDRGPRPDQILDRLIEHHDVDIQWGNHDVVWMGAAAGSPICIFTVLKTTVAYNNLATLENGYGINLRPLEHLAEQLYADTDARRWRPHIDPRTTPGPDTIARTARMHKAVTVMMLKLEAQVIARNPDFECAGRDYLNQINYEAGTVRCGGKTYTSDAVTLMTLHASKGLEFPAVMICGADQGMIPLETDKGETDKEEERRLFFVGMTRAKEELILISTETPSEFLAEIPEAEITRQEAWTRKPKEAGHQMSLFEM